MRISRRTLLGTATAALPLLGARIPAQAQAAGLKIGVLGDESGVYRDLSGPVAVAAVRQAVAESKAAGHDFPVDVIVGDHQNKPDIGAGIAKQWIERDGVNM